MPDPVSLGQFAKDETSEEELPPKPNPKESLCINCYHQFVCHVNLAIRLMEDSAAIGQCRYHLPVSDGDLFRKPFLGGLR